MTQKSTSDTVSNNVMCVKGILDLIFAGLSGDIAMIDAGSVQVLINDAQDKLDFVLENV